MNNYNTLELNLLFGKGNLASLELNHLKVLHFNQHILSKHSVGSFLENMGVAYCPLLRFNSVKTFKKVVRNSFKNKTDNGLGDEYRDRIFRGTTSNVTVVWTGLERRYGLITNTKLGNGDFIGSYAGLLRSYNSFTPVINAYCVLYPVNKFVIDARFHGNLLRYINHSESPNLRAEWAYDRGLFHLLFFASKTIERNFELTIDYGRTFWKYRQPVISLE